MTDEEKKQIAEAYPRQVYGLLNTKATGLSQSEADDRLHKSGPNVIEKGKKIPTYKIFLENFISPMAILLWVAGALAILSCFIAEETINSIGILRDPSMLYLGIAVWLVNIINGIFSFMQQYKAGKVTSALAKMLPQFVRVIRDGKENKIEAKDLVVGDIMILDEGDKISADGRILMCDDFTVSQSALDGEATPVRKTLEPYKNIETIVGIKNFVFAGTSVSTGSARAVVYATGMNTEFGKIAKLTQDIKPKKSPLQKDIDHATKIITIIALTVGALVFILGLIINGLKNSSFGSPNLYLTQFVFALGMIVAFIPEGLSPTVTLSLAKAVQRMAKEGSLMKSLTAVETLGSTTVICSDKTGTLTKNEMTVKSLYLPRGVFTVSGNGYAPKGEIRDTSGKKITVVDDYGLKLLLTAGALCSDAKLVPPDEKSDKPHYTVLGDPTEACLGVAAEKGLLNPTNQLNLTPRIRKLPFDSVRKMMTTIHQLEEPINGCQRVSYTKGAPKEVLDRCTKIFVDGQVRDITSDDIKRAMKQNDAYARDGLRVLGMAMRYLPRDGSIPISLSDYTPENIERDLIFLGLEAMQDPPRDEIKQAIEECHRAGIKIIMVTGDYELTALAIAKKINIVTGADPQVITGSKLASMSDDELKEALKGEVIFARMAPDQKYRVVTNLQELGEIVAVTGDGVNDAPALKKADIGVAMGITGTDVAKDAADMIITDDNFASIVKAIKEGRTVYNNIKKFITYIFNSNVPEAIPFLLPLLTYNLVPQPLTILEVLFIDLGTDLVPALGLGAEAPSNAVMDQKPRSQSSHLIDKKLLGKAGLYGIQTTILSMAAFFLYTLFLSMNEGVPYHFYFQDPNNIANNHLWMSSTAVVLTSIIFCQIGMSMNCRTEKESVFKIGIFSNKTINIGIISELILIMFVIFLPWVNENVFQSYNITDYRIWLVMLTFPFIIFFIEELRKYFLRKKDTDKIKLKKKEEKVI